VLAEGTQEEACIPVEVHRIQEASAAAEIREEVQIPADESLAVHRSQLEKEAGVAVAPTEGEGAEHLTVVVEGEQHCSPHSDDLRILEGEHLEAVLLFAVGRRALLMGQRAHRH